MDLESLLEKVKDGQELKLRYAVKSLNVEPY